MLGTEDAGVNKHRFFPWPPKAQGLASSKVGPEAWLGLFHSSHKIWYHFVFSITDAHIKQEGRSSETTCSEVFPIFSIDPTTLPIKYVFMGVVGGWEQEWRPFIALTRVSMWIHEYK